MQGVRGSSFLVSLAVFAGSLGILWCAWAYLVGPWGSPGIIWDVLGALGSLWKVPGGSLRSRGLPRGLWKSLTNNCFCYCIFINVQNQYIHNVIAMNSYFNVKNH